MLILSRISHIFPRKGGGGGGGGGGGKGSSIGGSGGKGSSGGTSSSSSGASSGRSGSISVSSGRSTSTASSSSKGGGTPAVIQSGSPFTGRLSGGGSRAQVWGSSRIGSGYPYGGYGNFYGDRPFPYGFYPVFLAPDYCGGDEYGPSVDAKRPGGALSTAVVRPSAASNNASSLDSYYLVGDQSSVSTILEALVPQCGVVNASAIITYSNGTLVVNGGALVPHPEQVVQFYRASSFALALSSYNNTATLPANAPASNTSAVPAIADSPFPAGLNMTLLACLNSTIAASVPLLDVDGGTHGLAQWKICLIALVVMFLVVVLLMFLCWMPAVQGPRRARLWKFRSCRAGG